MTLTQEIKDQDKIEAREILFLAIRRDPHHCRLAINNYSKEISIDLELAEHGHVYDRTWNPATCLFELETNQAPLDRVGWDDGTKRAKLKGIVKANAIYRLAKAILKTNHASREVHLVYDFFLHKNNYKLFDKIANNTMKSKQQKLEAIINKIQHMLDEIATISTEYQKQEIMTNKHIQENFIEIKNTLSPILENLYTEENNTAKRIQARSSIARVICHIMFDLINPCAFTITVDSYSEEEYQQINMAYLEAYRLFEDLSIHRRKLYDEKMRCSTALAEKLNNKLMLSTVILLKDIFLNQTSRRQNLSSALPSDVEPTIKLVLVLSEGTEQEVIMPINNLKKLTVYNNIEHYQETQQNCIIIMASDIGILANNTDAVISFLNFIATNNVRELKISNLIQLQELFDYFMVGEKDQEEIIMHTIKNNESQQLLQQSYPLLFSEHRNSGGFSSLLKEPCDFAEKLLIIAKNNRLSAI